MRAVFAGLALAGALSAQTPAQPPAPQLPLEISIIATPSTPNTVLVARSGRLVGALCNDKKLRLYSLPDNKLLREIDLAGRTVDALVMSEDGSWIAAGDHSGLYTVWNAATGAEQMHLQMPFYPSALAFSEDGKRLAIAPVGEPVQIFDPAAGTKLFELKRTIGGTEAIAFSRDRELIATADGDTAVRIYDGRSGALLDHNTDFLLEPFAVAFTPDGKQLLAAGADKTIAVLDVATGEVIRKTKKAADPFVMLDISWDGTQMVAEQFHADNFSMPVPLLVMDTATGKQLQEWRPANMPLGGGWTIDGHLLVGTTGDTYLHIWRVR